MANDFKVIVVGAGVAGLYAAWRMCIDTTGKAVTGLEPSDVLILESGSRTGGRLFTMPLSGFLPDDQNVPRINTARGELGGMRFLNFHTWVGSLVQNFGLEYVSFPADAATNWHYLRGSVMQSFSNQASTETFASEKVYALTAAEQQAMQQPSTPSSYPTPGSLIANALAAVVNPADPSDLRVMVNQLLTTSLPDGTPLWQRGLWNVMIPTGNAQTDPVSNEAYEFWTDAGAYDSVPSNWNAATAAAMVLSDFSNTSEYYAVSTGYQSIPDSLYQALNDAGVQIRMNSPVVTVATGALPSLDGFTVTVGGGAGSFTADNVILAMPPRAIQLLREGPVTALSTVNPAMFDATAEPMVKIYLVYKNAGQTPWWAAFLPGGVADLPQYTRLTTDLPLRQTYNFGVFPDASGQNVYSLVQVSYTDALRSGYWAGLLTAEQGLIDSSPFGDLSPLPGAQPGNDGFVQWTDGSALSGHPLFSAAHAQFVSLLTQVQSANSGSGGTVVEPSAGAAMDWGSDPFGGGYNTWNVGVDVNTVYWSILNPLPMQTSPSGSPTGTNGLFIVGEGYSVLQGWVEGALWTVEDALKQAYGNAWTNPAWYSSSPVPAPSRPSS